jgi:SAM-dependent methyltransferase
MEQIDHKRTYKEQSEIYERLVDREDYQAHILSAIQSITSLQEKRVVDLGSGTGRLAGILNHEAAFITGLDLSFDMSLIAHDKGIQLERTNVGVGVADHREIPLPNASFDLVISGWSICYLVDWYPETWERELVRGFSEMQRVLKENGMIIILETMGTGFTSPHPPTHLEKYFRFLTDIGLSKKWIRTDYRFKDISEAKELAGFFFGIELVEKIKKNRWRILPECTGVWWSAGKYLKLPNMQY